MGLEYMPIHGAPQTTTPIDRHIFQSHGASGIYPKQNINHEHLGIYPHSCFNVQFFEKRRLATVTFFRLTAPNVP